ncbi:MAG: RNA 2',3'-cyclic phosphodiesterase [Candidatus Nitronauta litoralis]|uniref:RNA 2',3'-cyclic phosphodiesterase n=1 Tax=Candidatus Nitronauta litoralis TaxID=2705533 RepID=A0A7T0BTA3_9BACT|nr:MAG: RNA 2',3'-cyclic phosphodiesterase [Candidatus Nitronauta litoralis]
MHAIRTFVAIDIPSPARKVIAAVQRRFLPLDLKASWVRPENVHLTLKFLGNIDPDRVPEVSSALAKATLSSKPFSLSLGKIGLFPGKGAPRVIWVGLKDAENRLKFLHQKVEMELSRIGFEPEARPFSPHLTVGRIKSRKNVRALKERVVSGESIEQVTVSVTGIVLYKSELTPEGSRYINLKALPLGDSLPNIK